MELNQFWSDEWQNYSASLPSWARGLRSSIVQMGKKEIPSHFSELGMLLYYCSKTNGPG